MENMVFFTIAVRLKKEELILYTVKQFRYIYILNEKKLI